MKVRSRVMPLAPSIAARVAAGEIPDPRAGSKEKRGAHSLKMRTNRPNGLAKDAVHPRPTLYNHEGYTEEEVKESSARYKAERKSAFGLFDVTEVTIKLGKSGKDSIKVKIDHFGRTAKSLREEGWDVPFFPIGGKSPPSLLVVEMR